MPRKFEDINPDVLDAVVAKRHCHCKTCGVFIHKECLCVKFRYNGTTITICPTCYIGVGAKLVLMGG